MNKGIILSVIIGVAALGAIIFVIRKLPANPVTNVLNKAADVAQGK